MADPNLKRANMDNQNGESSSPKNRKIQLKLIDTDTQSFEKIRNMPGFVDHTHFIHGFLLENKALAIFAPRRFGKSSHLDMLLKFLEIDIDETTRNGPAKGRKNYKLFEGTRIIFDDNYCRYGYVVEDHLGKHPVIHLDFQGASIDSIEQAEMHCRYAVHKAYLNHSYLKTSTKLEPDDDEANRTAQHICQKWCDIKLYKNQDLDDCLINLTKYLFNHFNGAKVYILVDEFDAISASALRKLRESDESTRIWKLRDISDILASLLGSVTKGRDEVAGALFTGVLDMSVMHYLSDLNNIKRIKFLDGSVIHFSHKSTVPFYGATTKEVKSLIEKLVVNKQLVMFEGKKEFLNDTNELDVKKIMDDVQSRYNCYFDVCGTPIFRLSSVLRYLESGDARNYWYQTDEIDNLYMILKSGKVAFEIMKLMKGGTIQFEQRNKIMMQSVVELYDLLIEENKHYANCEDVFNFLLDEGFLTYHYARRSKGAQFKLPNAEIRETLSNMIGNIVKLHWKIDTTKCTNLINDISLSLLKDEKALQKKMLDVYEEISLIFTPLDEKECALVNEAKMLCTIYTVLNNAQSFLLGGDLPVEDGEDISERPDFLMLHKNDNVLILWELKYNNNSSDKYTTSLYALQEARGIVATENKKTKKYMESLKKLGREALVIGFSLDSAMNVSMSYAIGMEEKIFFKSEWESTSFSCLYEAYNAVPLTWNSC